MLPKKFVNLIEILLISLDSFRIGFVSTELIFYYIYFTAQNHLRKPKNYATNLPKTNRTSS